MPNQTDEKQILKQVALRMMELPDCYDEFKHGLDYEGTMLMDIIAKATGFSEEEVEKIRLEYLGEDEDE